MKTEDFNFELPESLIAQYPPEVRGLSRLMVLDRGTGAITDSVVADIASFVEPGTLMVFNDSKVRKARIYGICEQTGAKVEFVFLAPKGDYPASMDGAATTQKSTIYPADTLPNASKVWETVCSKAKRQRFGRTYIFPGDVRGRVIREADGNKLIEFSETLDESYFERHGHVPLPPYIKRGDTADDEIRYQTIYAQKTGSAASPTAGLHFTPEIIESLRNNGIDMTFVTLHVGLGTFLPVRSETVEEHRMHEEWFEISDHAAGKINEAKAHGKKILAVGTTSLRALESAWAMGKIRSGSYSTRIFIYPGYEFHVVDQLFTNFHTPKSTLLMLVSAFAGRETILSAYRQAVEKKYRFFSYGDAMLIR